MYRQQYGFEIPEADTVLWRYMDFTKFVSILAKQSLFFTRIDKLDDPFEGSLTPLNVQMRSQVYRDLLPEERQSIPAEFIKDIRRFVLVNCWHESEYESDAMWKLYAKGEAGVAIKTDFDSLCKSLRGDEQVYIGKVQYVDYEQTYINEGLPLQASVHKRKSFEHEKEVRAVISVIPEGDGTYVPGCIPDVFEVGTYHEVDLSMLIKQIVVPEYAQDWYFELVETTTQVYGLSAPVQRSSMSITPTW